MQSLRLVFVDGAANVEYAHPVTYPGGFVPAATITCKTCDKGELRKKKVYRMSAPVVFIGYIFLIPSIIGILIGVLGIGATSSAATSTSSDSDARTTVELQKANVPQPIVSAVLTGAVESKIDESGLTPEQKRAVSSAILSRQAQAVGAGVGVAVAGGLSIGIIVMSFVGGLLGWLLVMKKRVLKCNACGATTAAD